MTCRHVLGLIDAGPFADYPRAHLDAAWQHARQCATCGPALGAAAALTADLSALPQPAPPPDLTAAVLARVAQIAPTTARAAAARPAVTRDWSAWATAVGGVTAGFAIVWALPPGHWVSINIAPLSVGSMTTGLVTMPPTTTGALVLATGLALYVAGLFAPLSRRRRS